VQAVHDRDERLVRPRDRQQEPNLLGHGLAVGPALELPDNPVQAVSLDAPSGVALRDLAVRAIRPEEQEQIVGKVVAADLGRCPPTATGSFAASPRRRSPGILSASRTARTASWRAVRSAASYWANFWGSTPGRRGWWWPKRSTEGPPGMWARNAPQWPRSGPRRRWAWPNPHLGTADGVAARSTSARHASCRPRVAEAVRIERLEGGEQPVAIVG
jgi:hypothetical protein